jgi:hypothetical protein
MALTELATAAPEWAALLASIDRSGLTADELLAVIAARVRLLWHIQGERHADYAQAAFVDALTCVDDATAVRIATRLLRRGGGTPDGWPNGT